MADHSAAGLVGFMMEGMAAPSISYKKAQTSATLATQAMKSPTASVNSVRSEKV
jgi:hypothetical protein